MKTVGVRELKAHLSRVLREVTEGNVYLVTDRGRVIAELRSPVSINPKVSDEELALGKLAAIGALRIAERAAPKYSRSPLRNRAGLSKRLLDADRDE